MVRIMHRVFKWDPGTSLASPYFVLEYFITFALWKYRFVEDTDYNSENGLTYDYKP